MNTKFNLFMAATAVLGLASCEKYVSVTGHAANEDDAEYVIVIDGAEGTKGAAATRSLDFADLAGNRTGTFTATLVKRVRGTEDFNPVDFQPEWSWSKDSEAFSGSQKSDEKNKYDLAAQAVGSGNVNVSASYCGNALASSCAEVTVADSREISWTDATTTVTGGMTYSATLNCNFAGTVTVSSDNGSFLVGESTGSLSSTAGVTFSESTGTAKTIYYKYTGSEETTVNMNAVSANEAISSVLQTQTNNYYKDFNIKISHGFYRYDRTYTLTKANPAITVAFPRSDLIVACEIIGTVTYYDGSINDIANDPNISAEINGEVLTPAEFNGVAMNEDYYDGWRFFKNGRYEREQDHVAIIKFKGEEMAKFIIHTEGHM